MKVFVLFATFGDEMDVLAVYDSLEGAQAAGNELASWVKEPKWEERDTGGWWGPGDTAVRVYDLQTSVHDGSDNA